MIVFINFGGRVSWREPFLFFLLSYFLNGGLTHLLSTVSSLTSWVTGDPDSPFTLLLDWLFLLGLAVILAAAWNRFAPPRYRQLLRQALFGRGGGNAAAAAAQARAGHAAAQHETQQERQQHWSKVVRALHQLPTDTVASRSELEQETAAALKQRLAAAGVGAKDLLEKQELVDKVLGLGGSSASSCSICCDDYVPGDIVRVLPCSHRYHIECVDRWFLSSASDYSRAPSCPMCNSELQLQ